MRINLSFNGCSKLPSSRTFNRTSPFHVESLEARQMLSSVIIVAAGETGLENMALAIDGQVVQTWEAVGGDARNSQYNWFQYDTEETLSIDQIEVRFINDFYDPANGVDYNLRVDSVKLDGFDYLSSASSVYSTGTYIPGSGITPGFQQTEYLHTDGSFFYGQASPTILWGDEFWTVERSYSPGEAEVNQDGDMVLRSTSAPISVTRQLTDFAPGQTAIFSVTSRREILGGSLSSDGRPWATAGINFYNSQGYLISQNRIDINHNLEITAEDQSILVPAAASTAFGWIWVDQQFDENIDVSTIISDFSLTTVDFSHDTTAPTASMTSFEFTDNFKTEINFLIQIQDDFQLTTSPIDFGGVEIYGPNGQVFSAGVRTGVPPFTLTESNLIYGFTKTDVSRWTESDNGVYSVVILDSTLSDAAGNAAGRIELGTITVNITDLSTDVTPPTIRMAGPISEINQPVEYVSFSVVTSDDQDSNPQLQSLTLVAPDGTEQTVTAIAGGYDFELNEKFEIFWVYRPVGSWGPAQNGTWSIRLDANRLTDESGNATLPKLLGEFVVNIPVQA